MKLLCSSTAPHRHSSCRVYLSMFTELSTYNCSVLSRCDPDILKRGKASFRGSRLELNRLIGFSGFSIGFSGFHFLNSVSLSRCTLLNIACRERTQRTPAQLLATKAESHAELDVWRCCWVLCRIVPYFFLWVCHN